MIFGYNKEQKKDLLAMPLRALLVFSKILKSI